jgi:hypothetical protein
VLVPIAKWQRMRSAARPNVKELLLSGPRFENIFSRSPKVEAPVKFE